MDERTLHILLVDDNSTDLLLLEEALADVATAKFVMSRAVRLREALQRMKTEVFDAVLLDLGLPDSQGLDTFVQMQHAHPSIPVIIVSNLDDEDLAARAVQIGAQDYLVKGVIHGSMLARIIRYAIERKRSGALLKESQQRLSLATESAQIGIWDWDAVANKMVWDEQMYKLYGIVDHDFTGAYDAWQNSLHPEDRADAEAEIVAALDGSRDFHTQFRIVWPNGEIRHIEAHAVVRRASDGRALRMVGVNRDISERKQAEEAQTRLTAELQQQHQRLDDILAHVPGMVWETWGEPNKAERRVGFMSDYVTPMLGYSSKEWLATPNFWISVVHPDDRERAAKEKAIIYAGGQGGTGKFRFIAKDGRVVWAESQIAVICDGAGQPLGMRGVTMDITKRMEAEEELRFSEQRFSQLIEQASDGVFVIDNDGRVTDVNEMVCQRLGYTRQELLTMNVPQIEMEFGPDSVADLWSQLVMGKPLTIDGIHRRKDGTTFPVEVRVGLCESNGSRMMMALARDVSERRLAEEERDRFFTLSLDILCIADSNGYFKRLNPSIEKVLGFTRAELMAKPFLEFVHPEDVAATVAEVKKLSTGATTLNFENRYLCRDGSYKWLTWAAAPHNGLIYCVAHDVTTLKRTEAKLLQSRDELKMRVADRTLKLELSNSQLQLEMVERKQTEVELQRATKEAEAANLAKSEFLSRMSHELRTPLNAILGFGQVLDRSELSSRQKESVLHIVKGGRHLLDLVNEILDIAGVEAGKISLSLEPIALADVIPESCALIRPLADERNIRLDHIDPTPKDCYVLADRQRLLQVMLNLLSNAIKYNHAGGQVEIFISQTVGGQIRIAVRDTGAGISQKDMAKLFTPFERLHAADSAIEGTGLGLVLSQRLIIAMGGTIQVESIEGMGSTFSIDLPQVVAPLEILKSIAERGEATERTLFSQRDVKILCIEDNLSNLRLIEVILESRAEITLLSAMQGSLGLDLARQHVPDIILLDLNLPDIPGAKVLAHLRRCDITREIPVVVISADATPTKIEMLLAAGAQAYLTKPLDVGRFLEVIDEVLAASTHKAHNG